MCECAIGSEGWVSMFLYGEKSLTTMWAKKYDKYDTKKTRWVCVCVCVCVVFYFEKKSFLSHLEMPPTITLD
jgi:hypothetical protein